MVNSVEGDLKKPHPVTSLMFLAAAMGFVGVRRTPVNLSPDPERPQVAAVMVCRGTHPKPPGKGVRRESGGCVSGTTHNREGRLLLGAATYSPGPTPSAAHP